MPNYKLLFFLLFSIFSFSQQRTIVGTVKDTLNEPLERANVIAKPLQENAKLKFSIADHLGRFKLELEPNVAYEIKVSYLGYKEEILNVDANSSIQEHHFKLKEKGEKLNDIVITYDYKPVIAKKDTLIYDVAAFVNGNERKMKEVLEKLPGVEVEKNGTVTVQGKKVTQMLVDNKAFFGGGSKLAVENIPADAIDKIEVLDNFNQVGFLKQVSDSEDLAMNVKLKEEKKKFVFGDVQAGAEVANDNGFHLLHSALFYYSSKQNISFIGDINTIGKRTFTFDDLMRFQGGVSSFLSDKKSLTNLYTYVNDNKNILENKSKFAALNFSQEISSKLDLDGFFILSDIFTANKQQQQKEYLQSQNSVFENIESNGSSEALLSIGNIKLDYSPTDFKKIYYNAQYQSSVENNSSFLNSIQENQTSTFETIRKDANHNFKQYLEWHKQFKNKNHNLTFVVNQVYEHAKPTNDWLTNTPFLAGLIPLENDNFYSINQIKETKNHNIETLVKHYWILNNFNHLYTNLGNDYTKTSISTAEQQLLSNGNINNFDTNGFGNQLEYQLNDAFIGFEHKFKIGKWVNKSGLYVHNYSLHNTQDESVFKINKTLIEPQWNSEYEFNSSESLKFSYKFSNDFPDAQQMLANYTLQNYNSLFKGNALLNNEVFHNATLFYSKFSTYKGVMIHANASYSKKVKTIRNEIALEGINQFMTPILTDNPETSWRMNGSINKKIKKFRIIFNASLNGFEYVQIVNSNEVSSVRNAQNVGLKFATASKKLPEISIGYDKGFNQLRGISYSKFETDIFKFDFSLDFFKDFTFETDYQVVFNSNSNNLNSNYRVANASLTYHKKNNPFIFSLEAQNYLNNGLIENNSFSDFMIMNQKTFVLPRIIMFSISYKL